MLPLQVEPGGAEGSHDEPIVALGLTVLRLLGLDNAKQAARLQTAADRRLVRKHEHVERIAVPGKR